MATRKGVLLLAPVFMNLYKDIWDGLIQQGFDVTWVEDCQITGTPYNKLDISRKTKSIEEYDKEVNAFWKKQFEEFENSAITFDYFLAINGMMVSSSFFITLREKYPKIKTIVYFYDRIEGHYELDCFFKYYDRVYTFDRTDSLKYSINHLPYYWKPFTEDVPIIYDVFGMASFKYGERYEVFSRVRQIAINAGLRVNILLWYPPVKNRLVYIAMYYLKRLFGKRMLPLSKLKEGIFTDKKMPLEEFRRNICQSKVVIDTNNSFQDGLTARFMWALSAGKKIIMTNKSVRNYPFYNPKQIFLLEDNYDKLIGFIKEPFLMAEEEKETILPYRIDNWLNTLLN